MNAWVIRKEDVPEIAELRAEIAGLRKEIAALAQEIRNAQKPAAQPASLPHWGPIYGATP